MEFSRVVRVADFRFRHAHCAGRGAWLTHGGGQEVKPGSYIRYARHITRTVTLLLQTTVVSSLRNHSRTHAGATCHSNH